MDRQIKERIENICIRQEHSVTELDVLESMSFCTYK